MKLSTIVRIAPFVIILSLVTTDGMACSMCKITSNGKTM